MIDAHEFLQTLALVLCVAAGTTVVSQRLRLPVVFGYLIAGMIVGPYLPVPLTADAGTVQALSELGVILLMFSLGLEFSIAKLLRVGRTAGLVAIAETSTMMWLGYGVGQMLGWSGLQSVYAGAMIAIASTTIIVKAFEEQGVRGRVGEIVFGVLIVEDLIAIFLLVILTTLSSGDGMSPMRLAISGVRLVTFLLGLFGIGLLIVPRFLRAVTRTNRSETTLVASIGICFAAALLALQFGYSVALGAFIAGTLVAEAGEVQAVERLIHPVRDMFVAIFFVSVGMLIDPGAVLLHWHEVLLFTIVLIVGKVVAVSISAFLMGYGAQTSVRAAMSLAQIGEFSFIIAGVGITTGATRPELYSIAIAVSAITTLATPWLIRAAIPTASFVDRKLPRALQTYSSLYASWIERVRSVPDEETARMRMRRLVRLLVLDSVMMAGVVIGAAVEMGRFTTLLRGWIGVSEALARLVVIAGGAVVMIPLVFGLVRSARLIGLELATRALPSVDVGKVDFAAAPRRALVVTLQLAVFLLASLPLLAVTQPFLPPFRGAAALGLVLIALGIAFWRSATNLQGHARAGAEVIVAALARQTAGRARGEVEPLERLTSMLPGLGEPHAVTIRADSPVVNRTLAAINLRGLTGATVLALTRDGEQVIVPAGREVLRAGDVLALTGTGEAIATAEALLSPPPDASAVGAQGLPGRDGR